jgi:hypothetical protein
MREFLFSVSSCCFDVRQGRRPEVFQKSIKTAAELESIITAELREHSDCDGAGVVVIRPMGLSWDAALIGDGPRLHSECNRRLAQIATRLRREFDLTD